MDTALEMKNKEALSAMLKVATTVLRSYGILVRGFLHRTGNILSVL